VSACMWVRERERGLGNKILDGLSIHLPPRPPFGLSSWSAGIELLEVVEALAGGRACKTGWGWVVLIGCVKVLDKVPQYR